MANQQVTSAIKLLEQAQDELQAYGQSTQVSRACDLIEQAVCSLTGEEYQEDFDFDVEA